MALSQNASTGDVHYVAPATDPRKIGPDGVPLPPFELVHRVGSVPDYDTFLWIGASAKQSILNALPQDFTFEGKRVLDFGCGIGRVLRHFNAEAQVSDFWGCDIDMPSILWANEHLSPPFHVFQNSENACLPLESNSFDLVLAISVFTHLNETWNQWLAELRRILKPGGLAFYTFLHRLPYEMEYQQPFPEDSLGMLCRNVDRPWDQGGPTVFHSTSWLTKNWGSLYDIEFIALGGLGGYQSVAMMRKPLANTPSERKEPVIAQVGQLQGLSHTARASVADLFPPGRPLVESGIAGNGRIPVRGWIAFKDDVVAIVDFVVQESSRKHDGLAFSLGHDVVDWKGTHARCFDAKVDFSGLEAGRHQLEIHFTSAKGDTLWYAVPLLISRDGAS